MCSSPASPCRVQDAADRLWAAQGVAALPAAAAADHQRGPRDDVATDRGGGPRPAPPRQGLDYRFAGRAAARRDITAAERLVIAACGLVHNPAAAVAEPVRLLADDSDDVAAEPVTLAQLLTERVTTGRVPPRSFVPLTAVRVFLNPGNRETRVAIWLRAGNLCPKPGVCLCKRSQRSGRGCPDRRHPSAEVLRSVGLVSGSDQPDDPSGQSALRTSPMAGRRCGEPACVPARREISRGRYCRASHFAGRIRVTGRLVFDGQQGEPDDDQQAGGVRDFFGGDVGDEGVAAEP